MGDTRRIIQQWIQTDAALGAVDLPIPRAKRALARPKTAAPARLTASAPAPARVVAPPPVPRAQPAIYEQPAIARPRAIMPRASEGAAVPKSNVVMPSVPTGDILALPILDRPAKLARMNQLQEATLALLTPLLNDVATKVVFGEGDIDASILFVGEGPGIEEDKTGRPFVGRSGVMLDKWLASIGQQRAAVYIANIVKLRAAEWNEKESRLRDRPPTPEEVARAIHILHEQIEIVRPRAIVTLGASALKWLTGTTEGIMKIRGAWMRFRGIPLMPTYHPAFLLHAYTDENRKKVYADLLAVKAKITA